MATPKVLFVMADYGHDPTETAVPFEAFVDAGFDVSFVTENGKSPECDKKMLEGITQKLLGANKPVLEAYRKMREHPSVKSPLSWTAPDFSMDSYNLLFFPGGHEKSVRQVIDSEVVHKHIVSYFPKTKKGGNHAIGTVCHGVLVVSESLDENGNSVLKDVQTTTLPSTFEGVAYWGTRAFLGDYYKTYGAGSESCEQTVLKRLGDKKLYKSSLAGGDFVVEDDNYNYLSGRFPGDVKLLSKRCVENVKENMAKA